MPETFGKEERLKNASDIEFLFKKGTGKTIGSLRIVFAEIPREKNLKNSKIGVSVSKKLFKRAVDRNRVKRLLRVCYRHHKQVFSEAFGRPVFAMIIWVSPKLPESLQQAEQNFLDICYKKINH